MAKLTFISLLGPLAFLVFIVGFSVYYAMAFNVQNQDEISGWVAGRITWILLAVQLVLLAAAIWLWPDMAASTKKAMSADGLRWALIGAALGVAVFLAYVLFFEGLLIKLQSLWDYVPAGSVVGKLALPLSVFFIANCLLAPITEEIIYRGWLLPKFMDLMGLYGAIIVSSLLFGLLHWAGGFWYMMLTALLLGVPTALLYVASGSILAPLAAHMVLNLCEFAYAYHMKSTAV